MVLNSPFPVEWAPSADADLGRIRAYIAPKSPVGFQGLVRRIVAATDRLAEFPEAGVVSGRYRYIVVAPYRLYYRFDGEKVVILCCWDSRRNPAALRIVEPEAD